MLPGSAARGFSPVKHVVKGRNVLLGLSLTRVLDPAKIKREQAPPLSRAEMREQAYDWVADDPDSRVACFTAEEKLSGVVELDRVDSGPLAPARATALCARAWPKSKPALDIPEVRPPDHYLGHHWAHNGLAHSQIYFVDHPGAKWPVTTSTYKWNEAQGVGQLAALRERQRIHLERRALRVDVLPERLGLGRAQLRGRLRAAQQLHGDHGDAGPQDHAARARARAGLAHRFDNASCMTQGAAPPISRLPDAHDFDELYQIYNHAN